jgi:pimeloyl-ACP methyl ester carboxylesterase
MQRLSRDGVVLCFEEGGGGSPPLLLVHGWTCDHSYLAPQFEHFGRNHRVVAVDLRGHGESDKPQQRYTIEGFADDLAWLCDQLKVNRPIVVGHSMGGVIALAFAARGLASRLVTLDSPILPSPAVHENVRPFLQALHGPHFREVQREFVSAMLFIDSDDAKRKQRILDAMSSAPQHVMASAFESIFAFDHETAAAACKMPWLALYAAHVASDLGLLRAVCPHVVTGQTVGAGHFHQLEVPDQVNLMIERFLTTSVPQ